MEIVVTGRHTQVKQKFRDVVESKMNREIGRAHV